jgi:hypothetical protein
MILLDKKKYMHLHNLVVICQPHCLFSDIEIYPSYNLLANSLFIIKTYFFLLFDI